jgi:cyclophilin family peptidyl-prolyl cis-trans isomerase
MTLPGFLTRATPAAALAVSMLSACGGGGGDSTPVSPSPAGPVVASIGATALAAPSAAPRYGQPMLVAVTGTGLDQGLSLSAPGCTGFAAAVAPYTNTATQAWYTCDLAAVGTVRVSVSPAAGGAVLSTAEVSVPLPQVTLTINNSSFGVVLTLDPTRAPVTVDNFLAYVGAGFYEGTVFHRHAPGFVLQGGGFAGPLGAGALPPAKATEAPIALEVGRGLSNTRYTLAMARTNVPDSATSQFFINTADNVFLDTSGGGYAVFGSVTAGAEVVDAMQSAACVPTAWLPAQECLPLPNLTISAAAQTR